MENIIISHELTSYVNNNGDLIHMIISNAIPKSLMYKQRLVSDDDDDGDKDDNSTVSDLLSVYDTNSVPLSDGHRTSFEIKIEPLGNRATFNIFKHGAIISSISTQLISKDPVIDLFNESEISDNSDDSDSLIDSDEYTAYNVYNHTE